jgi:pyrroline-5-carboxylate reductase
MNLNKKVGFFGAGKMATALAKGLLDAGLCKPDQILASDVDATQRAQFEKATGAKTTTQNKEVARFCDIGILAVKPNHVLEVLHELRSSFNHGLLISIAAGVPVVALEDGLGSTSRVIRVMPNTPALVRSGASAFCVGKNATQEDITAANSILGAVGLAFQLPENMLDAVTGLSGSGPAYIFLVIEALSDGGVEMGLPRDIATKLAAQTVLGAAKLVLESGKHPAELKDMVTSPGGTTIEGLHALEEHGVRASFMTAVRAATEKSRFLGGK